MAPRGTWRPALFYGLEPIDCDPEGLSSDATATMGTESPF